MIQEKTLLIDFDSDGEVGRELKRIFTSPPPYLEPEVSPELFASFRVEFRDGKLSGIAYPFDPALILLILPETLSKELARSFRIIRQDLPHAPILCVLEGVEPNDVLELFRFGAVDFITTPLRPAEIYVRARRLLEHTRQREIAAQALREEIGLRGIIGNCPVFQTEIDKIAPLANCDVSVLISGETGTGKELFARAIHYLSRRAGQPFVAVNCGAIPPELAENELFGHERGAFTGASGRHIGLVKEADGGTLFLDEADSLPVSVQVKLLRFLQHKEYRPLGATKSSSADVRVIAASNADLQEAVKSGRFRQDFYYRVNVFPLLLPPLRDRQEDIPLLARHFLARYTSELKKSVVDLSSEALHKLLMYEWPGNVRELENVIQRAILLCQGGLIHHTQVVLLGAQSHMPQESLQDMKAKKISQFEKSYIESLLLAYQGNITRAAQAAQKERRTFWELIRKHNIEVRKYRMV